MCLNMTSLYVNILSTGSQGQLTGFFEIRMPQPKMDSISYRKTRKESVTGYSVKFPGRVACPVMIMLSGLPGTGKSYFSRRLAERIPAIILESDKLRKSFFPIPSYSRSENYLIFESLHVQAGRLLRQGFTVIIDATNLIENNRRMLYRIAAVNNAHLIIALLEAPPGLIEARLKKRRDEQSSHSDADWRVFLKMQESVEEIKRPHHIINTAEDITQAIDNVVREVSEYIGSTPVKSID